MRALNTRPQTHAPELHTHPKSERSNPHGAPTLASRSLSDRHLPLSIVFEGMVSVTADASAASVTAIFHPQGGQRFLRRTTGLLSHWLHASHSGPTNASLRVIRFSTVPSSDTLRLVDNYSSAHLRAAMCVCWDTQVPGGKIVSCDKVPLIPTSTISACRVHGLTCSIDAHQQLGVGVIIDYHTLSHDLDTKVTHACGIAGATLQPVHTPTEAKRNTHRIACTQGSLHKQTSTRSHMHKDDGSTAAICLPVGQHPALTPCGGVGEHRDDSRGGPRLGVTVRARRVHE